MMVARGMCLGLRILGLYVQDQFCQFVFFFFFTSIRLKSRKYT